MIPPRGGPHSETARKALHMAMGAFALLLRWIPWWQAVALAVAALAFNLFLLPRLRLNLYRPGESARGVHGIIWYPLAVLLLLVTFPRRPDIAAAAWGILAIGDGIATLAGRAIGGPRWPWNREKTLSGSAAFAIAGAIAGVFLAWWCRPALAQPPPLAVTFAAPILAAIVAAFVETIPITLDDNLSVAFSAGAILWIGAMVGDRYSGPPAYPPAYPPYAQVAYVVELPVAAIVANAVVAIAGYAARSVNGPGAICGALIGIVIFASLGWQGWVLLLITFVAATIASRTGLARKERLGIAEARGGRRGPGNAIANTGVAAIAAMLAGLDVHADLARLAFAASLAAGGSDTIASEIGKAFGRRTLSVTTWRPVPPGTSGAMSLEGTLAGVAAAIALGLAAAALHIVPYGAVAAIAIGSTAAALLESWLGATLESPGILNNDVLNFINTAAGAGVAIGIWRWLS